MNKTTNVDLYPSKLMQVGIARDAMRDNKEQDTKFIKQGYKINAIVHCTLLREMMRLTCNDLVN